ncbi:DUF3488 and DUF4129 domain-containing transglutaminase family protein [uncultured Lamprocystis sp.]|jgi:transglutaminase-like putative cysteine protease|uniref:transglutaminase TgpA family protein n=2 Tax=uncultured Lamprocystis sp. TaxID=543132 RepID=UPI0025EC9581|nr:DUF3488 and DUF4129 domain-containing transglutaminase family protein [uncultured Lamprocystis sp.]
MMAKQHLLPIDEQPERYQTLALVMTVSTAYLPLARYLNWRVTAFVALVLLLRFAAVRWPAAAPGRWLLLTLTFVGVANCLLANHTLIGKVGGTSLLATMLALKLLELRARRDHRISAIALCFVVVVQFLFDQSMGLTLYLGGIAFMIVALLVDLNGGMGSNPIRRAMPVVLRISLQALPLTVVLFALFPRLTSPLWSLGFDQDRATMGMSESMEPGSISELVINGDLAFRARFDQRPPRSDQLYWRGLVLWEVDNRKWSPGRAGQYQPADPELTQAAERIDYEIVLEPSQQRWMFSLDLPIEHPPNTVLSGDFQLLSDRPITTAKRYRLTSALDFRTAVPVEAEQRYALRLPANTSARMHAIVKEWQLETDSDWALVQKGLDFFNREEFHYTLLPPKLGANPWDEFLFETRSGFCEHYAGSFAVLMRIAGLPSRVVLGYLGGEPNRIGGYHLIWQSDAHAWVEVLIAGRGWVRVDPTSAVAPSRVDNRGASRLLGAYTPARFHIDSSGVLSIAIRQLRLLADSIDAAWQRSILDYSAAEQTRLLDRLGLADYGEFALAGIMVTAVTVVMGLILVGLIRQPDAIDPATHCFALLCRRLAAVGLVRHAHEGPLDFAARVAVARPDFAPRVNAITDLYIRGRYMPNPTAADIQSLSRLVKAFVPTKQRRSFSDTKRRKYFA